MISASAAWIHSLLRTIEEQDVMRRVEISLYLTAKIKPDDVTNINTNHLFDKALLTATRRSRVRAAVSQHHQ